MEGEKKDLYAKPSTISKKRRKKATFYLSLPPPSLSSSKAFPRHFAAEKGAFFPFWEGMCRKQERKKPRWHSWAKFPQLSLHKEEKEEEEGEKCIKNSFLLLPSPILLPSKLFLLACCKKKEFVPRKKFSPLSLHPSSIHSEFVGPIVLLLFLFLVPERGGERESWKPPSLRLSFFLADAPDCPPLSKLKVGRMLPSLFLWERQWWIFGRKREEIRRL